MTSNGEGEAASILADHWLRRSGLQIKLDKGFEPGTYCVYVEFDPLVDKVGFAAAHRTAGAFIALLKEQLSRASEYTLEKTEDPSRTGDPLRKRNLETTFLSFPVDTGDGRFHDGAMQKQFRVAFLRAGQAWDQTQAHVQTHRRHSRQERFRGQLAELLDSAAYAGMDKVTKERLLDDVTVLAFPPRGVRP